MKTHRLPSLRSTLALAAGVFVGHAAVQPPVWGQLGQPTSMNLRVATSETDAFTLGQLSGKPLRGANQEQFGSVADFLIDPQSGRVHFAVVPAGSGADGETFRLVPMSAWEPASGSDGITVRIDKGAWDKVGTMTQTELPARVTLNEEQRQRLGQQFAIAGQGIEAAGELVRASALKGRALRAGNDQVGTIEDVAIDVGRRVAAAVVKSASGFAGAEQKFIVPFDKLQWSGDGSAGVTTTLARNDFQQAQGTLTPTGFTGAPFTTGNAPAHPLQSAAQQAVNQAAPGGNVQVIAETKLLLRGTVDSEQKRSQAERAAITAAPGARIENQIDVRAP